MFRKLLVNFCKACKIIRECPFYFYCTVFPHLCDGSPEQYKNNRPNDFYESTPRYELRNVNGKWKTFDAYGNSFTAKGKYDFVTINNRVYVAPHNSGHLNLARGKSVDYAGSISFGRNASSRGQIRSWSNDSGHYTPSSSNAYQANLPLNRFRPWKP